MSIGNKDFPRIFASFSRENLSLFLCMVFVSIDILGAIYCCLCHFVFISGGFVLWNSPSFLCKAGKTPVRQQKNRPPHRRRPGKSFRVLAVINPFLVDKVYQEAAQQAKGDAQHQAHQHIGGIMDIQVESGKGDEYGQHRCWDAHALIMEQQHRTGFKGSNGVSGGEGKIMLRGYEQ